MRVLGLESSCDETAAAVVVDGRRALSNVISSQIELHRRYGGVVPELASRAHVVQIVPVLDEALEKARLRLGDLDGIAVTNGPGLVGALLVAVQAAKALAFATGLPLVGVNHVEGHLLAARLIGDGVPGAPTPPEPPFVGLIVSGGHTSLYLAEDFGKYQLLGSTRDDAAGEAYDKVAKMLGLPYPGGARIDALAREGNPAAIHFPRAIIKGAPLDFSFSGLKTAVLTHLKRHPAPQDAELADLCASFQEAVADTLTAKALRAIKRHAPRGAPQRLVLCGGVACNGRLRDLAAERAGEAGVELFLPPPILCTDNAAMIAVAGTHALMRGERSNLSLDARPSWRLGMSP